MRKACFLSMDNLGDFVVDDNLTFEPLKKLGWDVETLSWRAKNIDWAQFEAVVIRTPWDYQNSPKEFLEVLKEIGQATRLENPFDIVKWNMRKTYMRELAENGVTIVPTIFSDDSIDEDAFQTWQKEFNTDEIIIKPTISATANDTFRVDAYKSQLAEIFQDREYMVQPFIKNIITEGEFSLFYFGGEISHAILKTPKPNDFRVQEDFGGIIRGIKPSEELLKAGSYILEKIGRNLLYTRIDFVRIELKEFALMELELIEPALYFRINPNSANLFAKAFNRLMSN